jgi:DtxR family transcriptional regulator, manganese transport regulator
VGFPENTWPEIVVDSVRPENNRNTRLPQTDGFQSVRQAHQSEMAEDYVELIAELIAQSGEARPVDIARRLGVSQPTVTKNLARLKRDGLVTHEPYRSVFLTAEGQVLAVDCEKRHRTVVAFLTTLGISPEVAEHDAEGIEHHVSDETLAAFTRYIKQNS